MLKQIVFIFCILSFTVYCGKKGFNSSKSSDSQPYLILNSINNIYSFSFATFPQLLIDGAKIQVRIIATSGTKDVIVERIDSTTANAESLDGLTIYASSITNLGIEVTVP